MSKPAVGRVGVVGAGVAGLVCAKELEKKGFVVDVFEAAPRVGGRVQTDNVQGHQLDLGFQILIDSYPEVRKQLDVPSLGLRRFAPGAVLALNGKLSIVAHPFKCPLTLLQTIRTAFGWGLVTSCGDVIRLLCLARRWLCSGYYDALESPATPETTETFLTNMGLSKTIVSKFLRPFFEAIYVTPLDQQSSAMFQFVLRMLAVGGACLPKNGMRAVPEQLASALQQPVRLSTPVDAVRPSAVQVGGVWQEYDAVVVAADWPAASKLLQLPEVRGTRSLTSYFSLPSPAPVQDPLIILQSYGDSDGHDSSRVVNIGFPSVVQPSYAPQGRELAAVTVMGPPQEEAWVRAEIERILGTDCSGWQHLQTYNIGFHQPAQVPSKPCDVAVEIDGVYCCGDHRSNPTLDGAMRSGRLVAEAIALKTRH